MTPKPTIKPCRRPMARVGQLPIFKQVIIEKISHAGFELLLAGARRISEGQLEEQDRYYGSTMITLDLAQPDAGIRTPGDPMAADRLAELLQKDRKLKRRLQRIGLDEAARIAGQTLDEAVAELRINSKDGRVLIDVDVEGVVPAATRQGASS